MTGERGAKAIGTGEAKKEHGRGPLLPRTKAVGRSGAAISSGSATARLGTDEKGFESESESESTANGAQVGSDRGSE